jgi:hypothetical protein
MSQYAQIQLYRVTDLGLASTLSALNYDVVTIEEESHNRRAFMFADTEDLQDSIQKYWKGELRIEPQKLLSSFRTIKARIYNSDLSLNQ